MNKMKDKRISRMLIVIGLYYFYQQYKEHNFAKKKILSLNWLKKRKCKKGEIFHEKDFRNNDISASVYKKMKIKYEVCNFKDKSLEDTIFF